MESPNRVEGVTILVDHNMEGQAVLLWSLWAAEGWVDLLSLRLVRFEEVRLPADSSDRAIWRFAQSHRMMLLTDNRNMDGDDSLETTIREENTATSLPVVTVGSVNRLYESRYRERCGRRLLEIIVDLDIYLGTGRLFIP